MSPDRDISERIQPNGNASPKKEKSSWIPESVPHIYIQLTAPAHFLICSLDFHWDNS